MLFKKSRCEQVCESGPFERTERRWSVPSFAKECHKRPTRIQQHLMAPLYAVKFSTNNSGLARFNHLYIYIQNSRPGHLLPPALVSNCKPEQHLCRHLHRVETQVSLFSHLLISMTRVCSLFFPLSNYLTSQ
jgi:hypothetical protein